jgi:ATP-dependent DNA helicase RecQ
MPDSLTPESADPADILHRVFGHTAFRGQQEAVVRHVTGGGSALVLMPTGGGKSLCYQVPALCRTGIGIVVSPLIALMEDQVAAMRQQGVAAAALHSDLPPEEARTVLRDLHQGRLKLLYVSPERLLLDGTLQRLSDMPLALFAVDEAHCVSNWGHHFRPEYRGLSVLGRMFPEVPRLALTATADPRTAEDIRAQLDLGDAPVFRASFDRPNIAIEAMPREQESRQLLSFVREVGGTGIVYCATRARTETFAERLRGEGIDALSFHAGMEAEAKREAHRRFARGEQVVMAATVAFGMGIDRPDVRWVAHLNMPRSPESWYQEIGRAGRDGLPARALLLYSAADIALARHHIEDSAAEPEQKRIERQRLDAMVAIAETAECRTRLLLRCFGEEAQERCGHCDNCAAPPKVFDGSVTAQKLLSAILRTGQRFGAKHVIDVLRGRTTDKVLQFGHDRLPTFGVGKEVAEGDWQGIIRQMVARGLLDLEEVGQHGTVPVMTEAARPVLRGEEKLFLRAATAPAPRRAETASPTRISDDPMFEALRAWRRSVAQAQGVPAYVVFIDRTLADIAARRPATEAALLEVPGVGRSRVERYGAAILAVLNGAPPPEPTAGAPAAAPRPPGEGPDEALLEDAERQAAETLAAGGDAMEALRAWRRRIASALALPPYAVLADKTLAALLEARPADDAALEALPGIGPSKLARYGASLLRLVTAVEGRA